MSGSFTSLIPLILVALVVLVIAVWLIMRLNQKTKVVDDETAKRDVLDEGGERARRNQALIDAAPAAMEKSFGETSANANAHAIATAPADADAEAGASVTPTRTPETAPEPTRARAQAPLEADDLTKIKGVGPKLVTLLAGLGVTRLEQIAAWTESDVAAIDAQLGRFKGRIERDQWVEQAKLLISEDKSAYAARFGNNS
jgi:predicted flap endonuclease-1-like 5' DNA nuclease